QGDAFGGRLALEVLARRRDRRPGRRELAEHEAEPVHALEPPVPKELAVEGDREKRIAAGDVAGRKLVADHRDEMSGVPPGALRGASGRGVRLPPQPCLDRPPAGGSQAGPTALAMCRPV